MLDILFFAIGVVVILLVWIAIYDSTRFVTTNYIIRDKRIRQHCRMVVLADLHNKRYGKENVLLLDAIREKEPDGILIAGDILTANPGEKLDIALRFMEEVGKIAPVYYGNGNHEHRLELYPDTYGTMAEEYEKGLQKLGIERLINAHICLKEKGLVIYGSEIDKHYYKRFSPAHMDADYLDRLLGKPEGKYYTVLIAHNPDYFKNYAAWGADLTLSGHVHGGVVRIPLINKGVLSPAVRFFPKYDGGLYEEQEKKMILSRGLGMHTIPVRLFNPGELIVVDFEPEG